MAGGNQPERKSRKMQGGLSQRFARVVTTGACREPLRAETSPTMQATAPDNGLQTNTIGRNIVWARQYLQLTQGDLARRLGRDRRQISTWERGIVRPGTDSLRQIGMALGRHIEWFLEEHPEVP